MGQKTSERAPCSPAWYRPSTVSGGAVESTARRFSLQSKILRKRGSVRHVLPRPALIRIRPAVSAKIFTEVSATLGAVLQRCLRDLCGVARRRAASGPHAGLPPAPRRRSSGRGRRAGAKLRVGTRPLRRSARAIGRHRPRIDITAP